MSKEKSFSELLEKKIGGLYKQMKEAPELTAFIAKGVPNAVACELRRMMVEKPKEMVSVKIGDLMEFQLKVGKRGDSIALTPDFVMLPKGIELVAKDKLDVTDEDMESLSLSLLENENLIEAFKNAIAMKVYDDVKNEWVDIDKNSSEKGLVFSEQSDLAVAAACPFLVIIQVLANNKDASTDINYKVDGFGTFTVKQVKGEWQVTLSFDKEFKELIKSDFAIEAIQKMGL